MTKLWLADLAEQEQLNPEQLVLNVYRLKKAKQLSRWIFKEKTENWVRYINEKQGYGDKKHALVVGPTAVTDKKVMQYVLKSEEALEHLKYIKTLKKGGGEK